MEVSEINECDECLCASHHLVRVLDKYGYINVCPDCLAVREGEHSYD